MYGGAQPQPCVLVHTTRRSQMQWTAKQPQRCWRSDTDGPLITLAIRAAATYAPNVISKAYILIPVVVQLTPKALRFARHIRWREEDWWMPILQVVLLGSQVIPLLLFKGLRILLNVWCLAKLSFCLPILSQFCNDFSSLVRCRHLGLPTLSYQTLKERCVILSAYCSIRQEGVRRLSDTIEVFSFVWVGILVEFFVAESMIVRPLTCLGAAARQSRHGVPPPG